jgi:hypothetical protein
MRDYVSVELRPLMGPLPILRQYVSKYGAAVECYGQYKTEDLPQCHFDYHKSHMY